MLEPDEDAALSPGTPFSTRRGHRILDWTVLFVGGMTVLAVSGHGTRETFSRTFVEKRICEAPQQSSGVPSTGGGCFEPEAPLRRNLDAHSPLLVSTEGFATEYLLRRSSIDDLDVNTEAS